MLRRLPTVLWITAVWLALWGDLSWGNLVGGLLVAVVLLALVPLPTRPDAAWVSPVPTLRYLLRFLRDLVVATGQVAVQVLWPVERLQPAVVRVPLEGRDPGLLSLVANTISLTPGTLTLETDIRTGVLWVHVLHLPGGEDTSVVADARALERLGAAALRVELPGGGTQGPATRTTEGGAR